MMKRKLLAVACALVAGRAIAVPVIPDQSGVSGHINLAVGVGTSESNMLAEVAGQDLGSDTISRLDSSPDDEDLALPAVQFELAYTFADLDMQLYAGNQIVDELSFDLNTTLETNVGIRQEIEEFGRVDFSLAASSLATDVWKDPYVVDSPRGNTERTALGLHLAWDEIFSTGFELQLSSKEVDIDDERSGRDGGLGLSGAEQRALRRTGQMRLLNLDYDWTINERHRLSPGVSYTDADLDGEAMAGDGFGIRLKHLYTLNRWRVVSSIYYHEVESDGVNPIYGKTKEIDTIGGSITAFYARPFGLQGWTANASASYYDGDANIDFYDSTFGLVSVGMLFRFD